jgi:hypothetical protein
LGSIDFQSARLRRPSAISSGVGRRGEPKPLGTSSQLDALSCRRRG